ncbi:MAG: VIT domain-containing protein [Pyrinomonadaceae bacterium]
MRKLFLLWIFVCSVAAFGQNATEGSLFAVGRDGRELGACPLKTTAVKADISGFMARVTVKQEFENKFPTPIEAIYVFPLSQKGAVDRMTMTVGTRVINGKIMRREEARHTYEAAKSDGKTASLLDQERPNMFTQSVANIMPGEAVTIEISYVETLKYEDGAYEFVFPMTVGPRYIPGGVKDAAKISPPIAETRNGSDISIEVNLNAGVPVEEIRSISHQIEQISRTPNESFVTLRGEKTIPNKDFILRYDVTGKRIEDAVLTHRDERGGFFTMILQPPDKIANEDQTPKEIVFVLDTSGSMSGFPIEKAKEAMRLSLDGLYPDDTFNLITFAGSTEILFDKPVPATQANLERAQAFLAGQQGYGGTAMMKAIRASLDPTDAQDHLRIVCFMTDGFIGNEDQIIAEVQKHPNARVFSFGIGSSVNRFLLDKIAEEGKGEAEYVALEDDGSKAARRFYERVRTPLLTDLSIDWNGLPVADIFPSRLTDLFSAKPVIIHGRYTGAASGNIKLKGKVAGQPYERIIAVNMPAAEAANDVLATLWARTRIDDIASSRLNAKTPEIGAELDKQITNLGLDFGLLTNFTSFVAVEDRIVNQNGTPVTVQVPVVLPEGVNFSYKKWIENDVAYIISGGGGGGGRAANTSPQIISSLPTGSRAASQLMSLSLGVVNTTSASVSVDVASGDSGAIDMSSSTVQTTIKPNSSGYPAITGTGSGYGGGRGSGSGAGTGDGYSSSENNFVVDGTEITNRTVRPDVKSAPAKTISAGVLNGRAVGLTYPEYSAAAKAVNAGGSVAVQVSIDGSGNVTAASAVSGHPLLRSAAEAAALSSKFVPTMISGKAVGINGVIIYNFLGKEKAQIKIDRMKVAPPTPEERQRMIVAEKLHAWLYAVVARLEKGNATASANELMFVANGKASVQIELTTRTVTVIDKLKGVGFEVASEKDKTWVVGKIGIDKLAALAAIDEVILVLPQI